MKERIGGDVVLAGGVVVPLSKAVSANGFVFLSGQLGLGEDGTIVDGGIEAQTRQAIENIRAVLDEAGLSLDHVVKITAWVTEEGHFKAFNAVYTEYFSYCPPARSTVVSSLLLPGAVVEIEAVAAR